MAVADTGLDDRHGCVRRYGIDETGAAAGNQHIEVFRQLHKLVRGLSARIRHKLDDITFHIPEDSYMKPWTFTSSDGRFEMDFEPVLDRAAKIDFKAIVSDQHQVFGRMRGRAVLDDGTVLDVRNMLCFAEKVHNRY